MFLHRRSRFSVLQDAFYEKVLIHFFFFLQLITLFGIQSDLLILVLQKSLHPKEMKRLLFEPKRWSGVYLSLSLYHQR
jgi:hypothetical protein